MAGASDHQCVLSRPVAQPAITTNENGKTPLDLVSHSAADPQIPAKNRETAFVSHDVCRTEKFPHEAQSTMLHKHCAKH
jgi:hypothetical protein